jgi:hypothetical protein
MEKILNDWRSYVNEQTEGLSDLQKQRASEYVASLVKFLIEASEPKLKDVVFELITNWNKKQSRGEYEGRTDHVIRSKGKAFINKAESAADKLLQTVINFEKRNQLPSLLNGYRKITGSSLTDDLQKIIILPMSVGKKIEQILKIFGTTKKTPAELKSNNLFFPGMQIILKQLAKSFLREGAPLNVRMLGLYLSKFKGPFTEKNLTQSEKEFIKQICLFEMSSRWVEDVLGKAWGEVWDNTFFGDDYWAKPIRQRETPQRDAAIAAFKRSESRSEKQYKKFKKGELGPTAIMPTPSSYDGNMRVYGKSGKAGDIATLETTSFKIGGKGKSYRSYTKYKKLFFGGGTTNIDKGKIVGTVGEDTADALGTALGQFIFKVDTKSKQIRIFDNYDFNQADRAMNLEKAGERGQKFMSTPSIEFAKHTKHALKNLLKIIKKNEKFNLFNFIEDMSTMVAIVTKNYNGYPVRITLKYDNNPSKVKPGLWKGFS